MPQGSMPRTEKDPHSSPSAISFFSTVHPSPWMPERGTFNRVMLRSMATSRPVTAVVPVPWPDRLGRTARPIENEYPSSTPTFWYLPKLAPLSLAAGLDRSTRYARKAARERCPGGVILTYWTDPDGTVAIRWGRETKRPVALIVGGTDLMVLANARTRRERIIDTLSAADLVVPVGNSLAERVAELGIHPERIFPLIRGTDTSRFRPGSREVAREKLGLPPDRPIVLWVGRMVPIKGLTYLLAALKHPSLASLQPLVMLAGEGPERPKLQRQVDALPGSVRVELLGIIPHKALPDWYRAADLVVLPSLSEGVPNVLVEAAACGTGFVASDVGGVREISNHPELELVPSRNPERLALRIADRLTGPPVVPLPAVDSKDAYARLGATLDRLA